MRTAACACGRLTLACAGEPVRISVCHCADCQRRTGSAFGVAAFFPRDQVTIAGPATPFERIADSGAALRFHFCPRCGSTTHWERSTRPEVFAVALGAFADPSFPAPDREVFGERSHRWVKLDLPIQE